MLCGSTTLLQVLPGKARAFSLRCKSWHCSYCRPMRRKRLVRLAMSGEPTTFLTLTSKLEPGEFAADKARTMIAAWRKLRDRIKAKWRYDRLEYLVVLEATKQGWPHLHILMRSKYIPQAWLSEQWRDLTGAHIVDIRRIDGARGAAAYVSKYVGKEPHHYGTLKRYFRSQRWERNPTKKPDQTEWRNATVEEINCTVVWFIARWRSEGRQITASSRDYVEAVPGCSQSRAPP